MLLFRSNIVVYCSNLDFLGTDDINIISLHVPNLDDTNENIQITSFPKDKDCLPDFESVLKDDRCYDMIVTHLHNDKLEFLDFQAFEKNFPTMYKTRQTLYDYCTACSKSITRNADPQIFLFDYHYDYAQSCLKYLNSNDPERDGCLRHFLWMSIQKKNIANILIALFWEKYDKFLHLNILIPVMSSDDTISYTSFLSNALYQELPLQVIECFLVADSQMRNRDMMKLEAMLVAMSAGNLEAVKLINRIFGVPCVFRFDEMMSSHVADELGGLEWNFEESSTNLLDLDDHIIPYPLLKYDCFALLNWAFSSGLASSDEEILKIVDNDTIDMWLKLDLYNALTRRNEKVFCRDIMAAIERNDVSRLKIRLSLGLLANTVLCNGMTIVEYAILYDRIECLEILIQFDSTIPYRSCDGNNIPLIIAISQSKLKSVNLLLGYTYLPHVLLRALQAAVKQPKAIFTRIAFFIKDTKGNLLTHTLPNFSNVIIQAAHENQIDNLRFLIETLNVNPFLADPYGKTVIHYYDSYSQNIKELIDKLKRRNSPC